MEKIVVVPKILLSLSLVLVLAGCQWDGGPLIKGDVGTVVDDSAELSVRVKQALRNSPQTSNVNIRVTTVSEDSVKISGFVSDSAILYEVERVVSQVEGVRFVVNSLVIR